MRAKRTSRRSRLGPAAGALSTPSCRPNCSGRCGRAEQPGVVAAQAAGRPRPGAFQEGCSSRQTFVDATADGGVYYVQRVAGAPPSVLVMKRETARECCRLVSRAVLCCPTLACAIVRFQGPGTTTSTPFHFARRAFAPASAISPARQAVASATRHVTVALRCFCSV
jgi:hypothetical protein